MDPTITKTVQDLPERFRTLFPYPQFNRVQSSVFRDLMETNESVVVTAPTGSGKTVLFELALVNLVNNCLDVGKIKAVYVAPVKALCTERFADWSPKFEPLGVSCIEVTGDSLDEVNLQGYQLILTTPEKWDSLTRRWRDNVGFVSMVKLMMIDEVHLLSDETRGPTLETIVCRMKTLRTGIRFVAVSATIFNLEDLAEWFGRDGTAARMHKFGNEVRPVALKRIVKSYAKPKNQGAYLFDIQLSYKLKQILLEYSEGKPALVFCSTRRGVVQTCQTLVEQLHFKFTVEQTSTLLEVSNLLVDNKLKEFVRNGAGYHHAGMTTGDRRLVQEVFTQGSLPVLVATTTLAMGVNLPAHLVVIKSTYQYIAGSYSEYPETYILQMVGRAGRPQFDTSATAVIMTRKEMAEKYQNLLDCREIMESSLHHNLAEHLNSEIVLHTITDLGVAMDWLQCTFLYQRAFKNPNFYNLNQSKIDKELEMMVLKEMNALKNAELIELVNGMDVSPTANGRLMSHYYLSLKTFEIFLRIDEKMTMREILTLLSEAHEFNRIQLRVGEKRLLNELNSSKTSEIIRFPMSGKIKTNPMKINCLTQAILGCLTIQDPSLQQEALRIINLMERLTKCLAEYLSKKQWYLAFYNAVLLGKCIHAKLWENSKYVSRQLDKIGAALGACLVSSGKTTFDILIQSHPCELERIVNRGPPLGSNLIDQARRLPQYQLTVRLDKANVLNSTVVVGLEIANALVVAERNTAGSRHAVVVIVGDTNNRLLHQRRVPDSTILRGGFSFAVFVAAPQPKKIFVKVVSEQWVGIDVDHEVCVNFMAKDLLGDDFVETRSKVSRKRAKKVDPVALSPKILKILEEKPVKRVKKKVVLPSVEVGGCCFDLEPDWKDFGDDDFGQKDEIFAQPEEQSLKDIDYPEFGQIDSEVQIVDSYGQYDDQKTKFKPDPVENSAKNHVHSEIEQTHNPNFDQISDYDEVKPVNQLFEDSADLAPYCEIDSAWDQNFGQFSDYTQVESVDHVFENTAYPEIESICQNDQTVNEKFENFDFNEPGKLVETENSTQWRITQILEPYNAEPVSFQLYDSEDFLPLEQKEEEIQTHSENISQNLMKTETCDSRPIPYHPRDVLWAAFPPENEKENLEPKKVESVSVKSSNLKSLKDYFPMVKAVRNWTKTRNDEKCFY